MISKKGFHLIELPSIIKLKSNAIDWYSKVTLNLAHHICQTGIVKIQTQLSVQASAPQKDSSNWSCNQVFILMATANIGMANLERLITF